ncbi:MAG TPA: 2-amino-4-hydroxy-6-hydroxymethyldihydropteridine diphosphokinase [Elusimicrobiota bacterium]|nr:2-amino-4-hydroxy-6-hydroxymethyldihydropteridine diphosphokinase [Elusimicrobiota bacterium]
MRLATKPPVRAFVGLGGNVGDRWNALRRAVRYLRSIPHTRLVGLSRVYETEPVGPRQRWFLNAVAEMRTTLGPRRFLRCLKDGERVLGRKKRFRWGPREIDMDLLFHGRHIVRSRTLEVPHPGIALRRFVLKPLCDLAPDLVHPVLRRRLSLIYRRLTPSSQKIRLYPKHLDLARGAERR